MKRNRIMNRNIYIYMILFILSILVSVFLVSVNIADAADCSACHADTGKPIKAKDTIEISDSTCLKCHSSDYPPTPMGYNTHLVHIGSYSVSVDYLKRHPEIAKSLNCDSCHIKIIDCRYCHVKGLPHIEPPLGDNCKGCHGMVDNLFRHPTVDLKIHNLFDNGDNGNNGDNGSDNSKQSNKSGCVMCHNPENMRSLKLANGEVVPIQEPHRLCYQCHSGFYNLWDNSSHYSNKTIPKIGGYTMTPASLQSWNEKWRRGNTCTNCHNPHNPSELYQLPTSNIVKTDVSILSTLSKFYLYIIGILLIVIAIILVAVVKYKIDLKKIIISKLSKLKLSKSKLPESDISGSDTSGPDVPEPKPSKSKWKLPKISIPISISVRELEEKGEKEEKIKEDVGGLDKKTEEPVVKTDTKKKTGIRKRFGISNKDIIFILGLIITSSIFYIIFGNFMPIVIAISESMSPHMERGDMIFYTDVGKIDNIKTYQDEKNKSSGHTSFQMYGDVIMYRPFGKEGVTPYIHRAMYYVEEGEEMWPDGPKAPHAGYITKGDNRVTNKKYDQQLDLSLNQPVKREWIVGIANFRIPYIGYIRLILPI